MKEIARTLSSAGLRVYPIDARGLAINLSSYIVNIGTMEELAGDTGGKAFYNSNDLTSLMRSALEDSSTGYLLTYSPSDLREDGAYHTIRVKVLRSRVKLRYRPGYYADTPKQGLWGHPKAAIEGQLKTGHRE
jgi:VWFA-related protein